MSWNKNTSNFSGIQSRVEVLKECLRYHILTKIGTVAGQGLNDDGEHDLYQLEYKDADGVTHILRQQMQRTVDCDSDDYIVDLDVSDKSSSYILNIPLEITLQEDMVGYSDEPSFANEDLSLYESGARWINDPSFPPGPWVWNEEHKGWQEAKKLQDLGGDK